MYIGNAIGTEREFLIAAIAYLIDTVFDVLVYYGLHWIANHWSPNGRHPSSSHHRDVKGYLHDATRIQAERMALVPIFIIIGPGGMWALDKFADVQHSRAFVIAFGAAIITTRIIHTCWGWKTGTFRDRVDFIIDDGIQIGRDLTKEMEERESGMTEGHSDEMDTP